MGVTTPVELNWGKIGGSSPISEAHPHPTLNEIFGSH